MKTTRRSALQNIAGIATVSTLPILGQNPPPENHHGTQPVTKQEAKEYQFAFFRPEQMETLDALTEAIIPADEHSPGAKAAKVSEYIDAIVADAPSATKALWREGLEGYDRSAQSKFAHRFGQCTVEQQAELLRAAAGDEDHPVTAPQKFFAALKRATIDGYYTSRIGIYDDLQYHGNAALAAYPPCTGPVR